MRPHLGVLILPLLALPASGSDYDDKIKNWRSWWWPRCTKYYVDEETPSFFIATCEDGAGNKVTTKLDLKPCCAIKTGNEDDKTHIEKCILRDGNDPGLKELGCFVYTDNPDNSKWTRLTFWQKQNVTVEDGVLTCFDYKGEHV
ncbi:hypothetical protein BDV32DRAFT_147037 [Aspergillus pseudonomiae]|uniref:Uncharacterized protein n=1 Tax=Aspergillus pseudonomiae TaxID=1506151 RepID=A0A5N6I8X7_9EURO|nr:uncharacterized protein BDV37DRAFT_276294 [Aspergillus pseudonomiae]KAB8262858.1 hypothetical protein BDV32DRAFT_147037 [Aspergillus pseudonomiae]KAE8398228.1 hypothetical protein BDV37DRAFT_276294 [Aspergillus pseudonomiae]